MRIIFSIIAVNSLLTHSFAQAPEIEWQKNLGGTDIDKGWSILLSSNDQLIIGSVVRSSDIDVPIHEHDRAFLVSALDLQGEGIWHETIGYVTGGNRHVGLVERPNGDGYWAGTTVDEMGEIDCEATGFSHIWLARLDEFGNKQEEICIGGSEGDSFQRIVMTANGFYMIGSTYSNDGHVIDNHGLSDVFLTKLNNAGTVEWTLCYGGSNGDGGRNIIKLSDNRLLISGVTRSLDHILENVNPYSPSFLSAWLLKIDLDGNIIWQHCYGGENQDIIMAIGEYANGDIWAAGYSRSTTALVDCNPYNTDVCWVMRLDAQGQVIERACFGGSIGSSVEDAILLPNDHLLLIGNTASTDGDVSFNHGGTDAWILQLDPELSLVWEKTYGGSDHDIVHSSILTPDGGLVFVGESSSTDGDLTDNHGMSDVWVVKLAPWDNGVVVQEVESKPQIQLFPNPANDLLVIQFKEPSVPGYLTVFDPLGSLVMEQRVSTGLQQLELQLSGSANGPYFLRMVQGNKIITGHFIKY